VRIIWKAKQLFGTNGIRFSKGNRRIIVGQLRIG